MASSIVAASLSSARAEVNEVRIAQQFGLPYLPLIVARRQNLIEAHARAAGLDGLKVSWVRLGGGAAVNDALISGSIDFATAGLGPLLTLWDKTRRNLDIRGVLALDASALFLNVNRPSLRTLADLDDTDRVALPAVKVSQQAILLQMAAEKAFGPRHHERLDRLTVSLQHPEAYIALLSGKSEITGHFGNSPFIYQELDDPKIHRLLSSEEILGGLGTVTSIFTTAKVRAANPRAYAAIVGGVRAAIEFINRDKAQAARIFVEEEKSSLTADYVQKLIESPSALYSAAPVNSLQFAEFMSRTGRLKNRPGSWRDYFFPDAYELSGT
jgi:NitT/TauT family transport system substrate-binding protein